MGYDTNVVVLQGRLTRDPEVKQTQSGKAVCSFSLAVGSGKDQTSFFDITAWEKKAEFAGQYLKKGSAVLVTGSLSQQSWNDKDTGSKRSKVIVNAQTITFQAGGKKEDLEPHLPREHQSAAEQALERAGLTMVSSSDSHFSDEDIPF